MYLNSTLCDRIGIRGKGSTVDLRAAPQLRTPDLRRYAYQSLNLYILSLELAVRFGSRARPVIDPAAVGRGGYEPIAAGEMATRVEARSISTATNPDAKSPRPSRRGDHGYPVRCKNIFCRTDKCSRIVNAIPVSPAVAVEPRVRVFASRATVNYEYFL